MFHKAFVGAVAVVTLAASAKAAASPAQFSDVHPGAFIGARVKLSIGQRQSRKPSAELAIVPTQSRFSDSGGLVRTRVGEGVSIGFSGGSKPTLNLAGIRVDQALALQRAKGEKAATKLGISDGGWIAIGIGVAVVAAGAIWLHDVIEDDKVSD